MYTFKFFTCTQTYNHDVHIVPCCGQAFVFPRIGFNFQLSNSGCMKNLLVYTFKHGKQAFQESFWSDKSKPVYVRVYAHAHTYLCIYTYIHTYISTKALRIH